jgi:hypothetical protein
MEHGTDSRSHHRHDTRGLHEPGSEKVASDVKVSDADHDVGVVEARERFGGVDVPATLAGMLAALGMAVVLAGLLTGAGAFGYQLGLKDAATKLSLWGLVGGVVTLFVAFLIGGWVAGRVARYNGGLNGLLTALWFVLLAALMGALGAWLGDRYNVFANVQLPQWFSRNALGTAAVISGLVALGVMFAAGWLGGWLGERYHRRADSLVARTRPGAIAEPRRVVRVR